MNHTQSPMRYKSLDGLRGILAVTVMLNHFIGAATGWNDFRPFSGAYISVIYFFMISGFVLTYSHGNKTSFIKYALTRLARLWPLHAIATIAMVAIYKYNALTGQFIPGEYVFSIDTIIKNLSFTYGVTPYSFNLINDPSWSVSIEFWASLLVPILFVYINVFVRFFISILFIISLIFFTKSGVVSQSINDLFQFFLAIAAMMLGSSMYGIYSKYGVRLALSLNYREIFLWFCFSSCMFGVYAQTHNNLDFFYILPFIPLMLIDHLDGKSKIKSFLNSNIIQFFGEISFPLYLIHSCILISGFQYRTDDVYISVCGASIVAIAVAYAYCVFIDQPLYRYLKSVIKRQNKENAASCTI